MKKPLRQLVLDTASYILTHRSQFKVCDICGRIVCATERRCVACHGYRFDARPARVLARVEERRNDPLAEYGFLPRR